MKTALIAGTTGLTGTALVTLLLSDTRYDKIIVLVRKSSPVTNPKITEMVVDFEKLASYVEAIDKVDDIFCCLGTTMKKAGSKAAFKKVDYEYPLRLAQLGEKIGINHFLMISAMGANVNSSVFYNKVKGETERDISLLKIPAITFFRPSLLLGDRKENRPGEKVGIAIAKFLSFSMVGPLKNYKAIEVSDIARAMIKEANDGNRKGVKIVLSGEMQP